MKTRLILLLAIIFIVLELFIFIHILIDEGISHEDNIFKYNHIKNIVGNTNYIYQFPESINDEFISKFNPRVYYSPQFLQAPFVFELLLNNCNEENLSEFIKNKSITGKIIVENYNDIEHLFIDNNAFLLNVYSLDSIEFQEFFTDARVYILESSNYQRSNWNHGYGIYVIYSENTRQILLLSQKW